MPNLPAEFQTRSGNTLGHVYIARKRLNDAFVRDLYKFWTGDGDKLIRRVAEEQPGTLLKCLTMLVPKEYKIEHTNPANGLTDEQLAVMVIELEERIAERLAGGGAKVISGELAPSPIPVKAKKAEPGRRRGKDKRQRKLRGKPRTPRTPVTP